MSQKAVSYAVLGAVAVVAALWLRQALLAKHASASARAVTDTAKTDGASTTPLQPSRNAVAAPADPLDWLGRGGQLDFIPRVGQRAADLIKSSLSGNSLTDWRIPYGNPESAAAAFTATKATNMSNYRPSAWSAIQFRTGV